MERKSSQAGIKSQARERRPSFFNCDALQLSCAGPGEVEGAITSHSSNLEKSRESSPKAFNVADAVVDDGSSPQPSPQVEKSSRLSSFSTASALSNLPSSSDPFEEPRPGRQDNLFSLDGVLPPPIQGVLEKFVPINDNFYRPLRILPLEEYEPGAIVALHIQSGIMNENLILSSMPLMKSLRHRRLYMPPPIVATEHDGIPFSDQCMIRNLQKDVLDNLTVLFVSCEFSEEHLYNAILQLGDVLKKVSLLVVNVSDFQSEPEFFVFDLRRSYDLASDIAFAVHSVIVEDFVHDFSDFMERFTNSESSDIVLVEAGISIRESLLPFFALSLNPVHPIHWSLGSRVKDDTYSDVALVAERLISLRIPDKILQLETYPRLRSLEYSGASLLTGSSHWLLSHLYWEISDPLNRTVSLERLPNLQSLEMKDDKDFLGRHSLLLGKNNMLWRVLLIGFSTSTVDFGNNSLKLEFFSIHKFSAKIIGVDHMTIRELEVRECTECGFLKQLGVRAEKSLFYLKRLPDGAIGNNNKFAKSFPLIQNAELILSKIENLRLTWEGSDRNQETIFTVDSSGRFDYLTYLEISQSRFIIGPEIFPNLRVLKIRDCNLEFRVLDDDGLRHEDSERQCFPSLEVFELASCNGLVFSNHDSSNAVQSNSAMKFHLVAPKLKRLMLSTKQGEEKIRIEQGACPLLNSFEWCGDSYDFLPFSMFSDGPLFPCLDELKMKSWDDCPEESVYLVDLLCIPKVSTLSLTRKAGIHNLVKRQLSCRFAEFSDYVLNPLGKWSPIAEKLTPEEYHDMCHRSRLPKMPNVELLVISNVVVHSLSLEEAEQLRELGGRSITKRSTTKASLEQKED